MKLHKSARREVLLADGNKTSLELTLAPNYGNLSVRSDPPNLEVVIDGRATGQRTPVRFTKMQAGIHDVQVLGAGKKLGLQKIDVKVGTTAEADIKLVGFKGLLIVTAKRRGKPVDAELLITGKAVGELPFQRRIAPGTITVEARVNGESVKKRVTLEPGGKARLVLQFDAPARAAKAAPAVAGVSRQAPAKSGGHTGLGITSLIAGGGGLVFGGLMYLGSTSAQSDADNATTVDEVTDAVSSAESKRTLTLVGVSAGAALIGLGIYLLSSGDSVAEPTVGLSPDGTGGWAGVAGRW